MVRKKCNPQKLPKRNMESPYCECPKFIDSERLFEDNVRDIAKSMIIIMIVCGIHECKANSTKQVIINIFKHYDMTRRRPNCAEPPKKMCKRNVLFCLAKHCLMTLVEAQLTYYIIKYALKAFFGPLPQNCVNNPIMDLQIICEQEAAWKRAAQRTIKVYAECEGLMQPLVHKYNNEIKSIYRRLFECMKKRAEPIEVPQRKFNCESCDKIEVPTTSKQERVDNPSKEKTETIKTCNKDVVDQKEEFPFANFRKCCKCNFPLDLCDCKINPKSGKLCMDCSQGPFVCDWYRMDKEPQVKSKDHICPVDCGSDSSEDDACICDLPQLSDCEIDETCTDSECDCPSFEADKVCVEESQSDSEEVVARMEGCCYCCHMPICDRTLHMESVRRPAKPKRDNDIFVEFQEIPPAKNIKNVSLPPEVPKKRKVRPTKEKSALDMDKNKQMDKDKNKQTGMDKDSNKDKDKNKDKDNDKNKERLSLTKGNVAKNPAITTKTDKTEKNIEPKGTSKEGKTIRGNVPSPKDDSRKSGSAAAEKLGDALRFASEKNTGGNVPTRKSGSAAAEKLTASSEKNTLTVKKKSDNTESNTSRPLASDDKKDKSKYPLDDIENQRAENSSKHKSRSEVNARVPGKTTAKKLPCCKCKKEAPKCKKFPRCKTVTKNRIVPAPILC